MGEFKSNMKYARSVGADVSRPKEDKTFQWTCYNCGSVHVGPYVKHCPCVFFPIDEAEGEEG